MNENRFFRYELRITDLKAAREFYADVPGAEVWNSNLCLAPLPQRAIAQGAPAHWLGHISTSDVEATAARIAATEGRQLRPAESLPDDSLRAIFRDPFGAFFALSRASSDGAEDCQARVLASGSVVWHVHHSRDRERSFAWYGALFGWTATGIVDLGNTIGLQSLFAWPELERTVGSMADTARLPHIHPQWLFCFRVVNLTDALARVGALGGKVTAPIQIPAGDLVSPCDDPQGAAFALYQFAGERSAKP